LNQDGKTALHEASGRGHSDLCQFLLEIGADPNLADNVSNTDRSGLEAFVGTFLLLYALFSP
jgi:ankyrin repeat protein